MLFGRGALQKAHSDTVEALKEREAAARKRNEAERRTMLARVLFRETVEQMDIAKNTVSLKPASGKELRQNFLHEMNLEGEYDIDRMSLRAEGDQMSGWLEYSLQYDMPHQEFDAIKAISQFRVQSRTELHLAGSDFPSSETYLWEQHPVSSATKPIALDSDEYAFVRSVAGLFLPEVIRELEREDL